MLFKENNVNFMGTSGQLNKQDWSSVAKVLPGFKK